MLAREAHEVPVDEEELGKPGLLDDLQLALQAARHRGSDGPVALAYSLETELVEKRKRRLACGNWVSREPDLAKVEVDVALLCDVPWCGERLLMTLEQRAQLAATFEVMLRVGEEVWAGLLQRCAMADRN